MPDTAAIDQGLKPVVGQLGSRERHWVGDGFFVSTVFSPHQIDPDLVSPFILLDHAAPRAFDPSPTRRGVGEHPHRGFETVTFAYAGEVEHRDSSGGGGKIGPGDVQWMTAASGVVHEEMHSQEFSSRGGVFEMVQLWVNLPARLKMSEPRYQGITGSRMPDFRLGDANGRLIAGRFAGLEGPARTHTPLTVFELSFETGGSALFEPEPGWSTLVLLRRGTATAQEDRRVAEGDLVIFDRKRPGVVRLTAETGTQALVLSGEPLNEPVVAYGPFVMNTRAEIMQAMQDYQSGKMGRLL
jgi:redox-sensitive bicupin YhaK (pirin superfamily)